MPSPSTNQSQVKVVAIFVVIVAVVVVVAVLISVILCSSENVTAVEWEKAPNLVVSTLLAVAIIGVLKGSNVFLLITSPFVICIKMI